MLNLFQRLIIKVMKRLVAGIYVTKRLLVARLHSMWGAETSSA